MTAKEYYENTKRGKEHVREFKNGMKVRSLVEPSEEYKEEKAKRKAERIKDSKVETPAHKRERLIQEKIRELAIAELKKEGKIND